MRKIIFSAVLQHREVVFKKVFIMRPINFRSDQQYEIKFPIQQRQLESLSAQPIYNYIHPTNHADSIYQTPPYDSFNQTTQNPVVKKNKINADSIYKWGSFAIMVVLAMLIGLSLKPIIGNPFSRKHSLNSLFENYKNNEDIITLSKLPGMDEVKQKFQQKVVNPMKYRELFATENVEPGMFCILYGPPGTGKTNFVKSAAKEVEAYVATFALSQEGSAFIHTTSTNIEKKSRAIIKHAKQNPNREFFVLFDEVEAILTETTKNFTDESSKDSDEIIKTFLMIMDKFKMYKNIRVFATTNQSLNPKTNIIGNMNEAAMSRFGTKIYVGHPDAEALSEAVRLHFSKYPSAQDLIKNKDLLKEIGKKLEGYSFRDLEHIRDSAIEIMMNKKIKVSDAKGDPNSIKLTKEILEKAINGFAQKKHNPNVFAPESANAPQNVAAEKLSFWQKMIQKKKKQEGKSQPQNLQQGSAPSSEQVV